MNGKIKFMIPAFAAVFALMFIVATPYVMADMGEKRHGHMIEKINAYCDMSPEEQAEVIAKHNKSDKMISKINEYCSLDEEGRQAMIAEYKAKWGGADYHKKHMNDKFAELSPEEREAKIAQFKEMKQAFSSISDEDREIIKSHFKEMKQEYATLSDEDKDAKHAEFKSKMEEFSALSLEKKILHLQEFANSLK